MAVSVYIIDEHAAVRRNLVRRLSSAEGIKVVGHSGEANAALREVRTLLPDLVLLEVKMKRADGVDVCSQATTWAGQHHSGISEDIEKRLKWWLLLHTSIQTRGSKFREPAQRIT